MTSTSEAEQVTEWGRELGVHLRALRRLTGLSQGRLASIVGTSQPSLSRLERGYVAKQVLLVIGVAQVITRALSRFEQVAWVKVRVGGRAAGRHAGDEHALR